MEEKVIPLFFAGAAVFIGAGAYIAGKSPWLSLLLVVGALYGLYHYGVFSDGFAFP
ncbi:hypothetical protein D3C77_661000 [compost metagenome]